jgi:DNA-binding transcriptional LysR family regulator
MRHILPQLHYFWVVAQTRSFTLSAAQLNISQSAVSYQIKKLEEQLGVVLVVRDTQNRLTPAGERLVNCCQEIFNRLDSVLDSIEGHTSEGVLTVTSATCLGSLILSGALKGLRDRHPGLQVKLHLSEPLVDMMEGSVDLAIRSSVADKRLDYQPLFKTRMVLAASKEYLAQNPVIKKMDDLKDHCLVQLSADDYDWLELRRDRPEIQVPAVNNVVYIDNQIGISHAIRSGVGIAYLPAYTISRELQEGSVKVLPLEEFSDIHISYYAACAPALAGNARIKTFVNFLTEFLTQLQHRSSFVVI